MKQDILKHKFSLGLSLEMEITEYEKLIDDFFHISEVSIFRRRWEKGFIRDLKSQNNFGNPNYANDFMKSFIWYRKEG